MSNSSPNDSHRVLASLMNQDYVKYLITQNVDNLHVKAGTPRDRLLELHGSLYVVECMDCKAEIDRVHFQNRMHARNCTWNELLNQEKQVISDGHVEITRSADDFDVPPCMSCNSKRMKPKVVFFGEAVPLHVAHQAHEWVEQASAVLVIGSSLATYSCYRLLTTAHLQKKPIGILTLGPTRADLITTWKGQVGCTSVLTELDKLLKNIC
ncbi:DHS-like NAD/FAD-binding domain-containing protein [Sporodiniella umbellata]|nr:DHS-like NAD/FAD-binding domain-containing protein [Sporodiniella umbellata]